MNEEFLQQMINLCGTILTYSVPIGIAFGLAEKACNLFFSMAFGDKRVRL
jgi:hypothetical protein